jgi:L-amino acid N-acyltransferase
METSVNWTLMTDTADSGVNIREAEVDDVAAIHRIYNHYVTRSVATFAMIEEAIEDRHGWFQIHMQEDLPIVVIEDGKGQVFGWASVSRYSGRCAYRQSVEASVYLAPEYVGRGYGSLLLDTILEQAAGRHYHCVIALICTENEGSIHLFKSRDFEQVGILREVGRKFDRWLDVMILQKLLPGQTG